MRLIDALTGSGTTGRLFENEPMARHTTFRIGGPAEALFMPASEAEITRAISIARNMSKRVSVVGAGSNLIVSDEGVPGLVILLGAPFAGVEIEGRALRACAGTPLTAIARAAQAAGLKGLEFASGIPGSVGGGCAMNAGAYGGQLSDVVTGARLLDIRQLSAYELDASALTFGYRTSAPLRSGDIITEMTALLSEDDPRDIQARMDDYNARRRDKQPLDYPSAGSAFKRPEGHFAGELIERAGLKGACVGGAMVSPKHAGFIINKGGATARDVITLINHVKQVVNDSLGVVLEPEIRVLGEVNT